MRIARTLILALRLKNGTIEVDSDSFNHYDSVCDIASSEVSQIIEFLSEKARKTILCERLKSN